MLLRSLRLPALRASTLCHLPPRLVTFPPEARFSTEELGESDFQKQKKTEISTKLKKFLRKVHPDLFHSYPELQKVNQESLQRMNHFFDCIEAYLDKQDAAGFHELESPSTFKFVFKASNGNPQVLKTSFFLPIHILEKEPLEGGFLMLSYYSDCVKQLLDSVDKVEKDIKKATKSKK